MPTNQLKLTFLFVVVVYTAPTDYTATTQVLTFGPEATQFSLAIPITDEDNILETIERFFARLVLTDPNTDIDVELNPAETAVQIIDNDGKNLANALKTMVRVVASCCFENDCIDLFCCKILL